MTTFTAPPPAGSSRLRQLDPDAADDGLQGVRDDGRLRVANDDVALAEVVAGSRLTRLRQPGLDDEMAELPLELVDTVHGPDAAAPHPAQVGGAGGVLPLR